jgi:hypothetical protein
MRSRLYSITETVDVNYSLLQDPISSMQAFSDINSVNYLSLSS